ncbi:hypothetical protein L1987_16641 [Smallanthus sonchifolius]|uniref:Uncharacterized protein n=1 Tax=Smallanthus sonchifolius TaxID=185202 RepID=A0ACB9IUP0_9ASTR|nr:hypothetical protein L1987_16641 [Smallanthus sonchifolius]
MGDEQLGQSLDVLVSAEIEHGGGSYEIAGKFKSDSSFIIHNRTFEELIKAKSCEALINNFTSPNPLLFSISITPFITLFKCKKNLNYTQQMDVYFNQPTYKSYNSCTDYNIHYNYSVSDATIPSDLPHTCQVIQLPVLLVPGPDGTKKSLEGGEISRLKLITLVKYTFLIGYTKKVVSQEEQLGLHEIVNAEENEMVRKMIIVGLCCIQTNPLSRPTISKVLEMLEDNLASLEIPPKPYIFSPSRTVASSKIDAYFNQPNYNNYNRCRNPSDLPGRCEVIQLPGMAYQYGNEKLTTPIYFLLLLLASLFHFQCHLPVMSVGKLGLQR